jgi:hypothetical protein
VKALVAKRDAYLETRLRELGPGWAVGYRLKQDQPCPSPYDVDRLGLAAGDTVKLEWEIHPVQLVNGELFCGHADFSYVVLKEGA